MTWESFEKKSKNLAYQISDLKNCADEPIAFCGAIQSGGLLLVVDGKTLEILGVSDNWQKDRHLWTSAELLGRRIDEILEFEGSEALNVAGLQQLLANDSAPIRVRNSKIKELQHGFCHRRGEHIFFEFDREQEPGTGYPVAQITNLVHQLKMTDSIEIAAENAAIAIRNLSKFDRVMIYRFDSEWNGEVIGESKLESLLPFLHLKYPASDIPAPARELFFQNKVRMISDIHSEAVPILTRNSSLKELDLGLALFRAVSPIYLQYLENMGVRASFAVPISVNDKLWGLISCHHYAGPRHPDHEIRSAFELASQIVSSKIGDLVARRRLQIRNRALELTQALLAKVAEGKDPIASFEFSAQSLLSMTSSTALFVKMGKQKILIGEAPTEKTIEAVLRRLQSQDSLALWKSNSLQKDLELSEADPHAAGALAVPFSLGFEDALIWFRPEESQEIKWGGKPKTKEVLQGTPIERLTPRHSFSEWTESVSGSSRPWSESDEECAQYLLFGFVQGIFSSARALSLAYKELERAAEAKDIFIGTISHELRTPLSAIIGWIEILKEYPQSNPEAVTAVEVIDRNAKLQVTLIEDLLDISRIISGKLRIEPELKVDVGALISNVLEALKPSIIAKNIALKWSPKTHVSITADPDRLRQIIWNLLNNAVKFTPKGGIVSVQLRSDSESASVEITDSGIGIEPSKLGSVFERFTQENISTKMAGGLGLGLSIVKALAELHGGRVEASSAGRDKGARFTVHLPVYILPQSEEVQPAPMPMIHSLQSNRLNAVRALIAEDNEDAIAALEIFLRRNGAIVETATNGKEALDLLKDKPFDLILSDVGMPVMDGYALMRAWREIEAERKSTPIVAIALTAYAASKDRTKALASGFQSHIPKPVDREELLAVIDSLGIKAMNTASS